MLFTEIVMTPLKWLLVGIGIIILGMTFMVGTVTMGNQNTKSSCYRLAIGCKDFARDNAGFVGASQANNKSFITFNDYVENASKKLNITSNYKMEVVVHHDGKSGKLTVQYDGANRMIANVKVDDTGGYNPQKNRLNRGDNYEISITPEYKNYPWKKQNGATFTGSPITVTGTVSGYIKTNEDYTV